VIENFPSASLTKLAFSAETFRLVGEGMREAVLSGTARRLGTLPVPVAAKTGTTEVVKGRQSNSSLIVYAPYDNPEIALSVVIENTGESYSLAIEAARDFLAWYFGR